MDSALGSGWSFEAFMLTYAVVNMPSNAMIFSDDDFTRFYTHIGAMSCLVYNSD